MPVVSDYKKNRSALKIGAVVVASVVGFVGCAYSLDIAVAYSTDTPDLPSVTLTMPLEEYSASAATMYVVSGAGRETSQDLEPALRPIAKNTALVQHIFIMERR